MPQRVLAAMATPMPDLYAGEIISVAEEVRAALPGLARTEGQPFLLLSNGHGAWDMATTNTLSRGDKVLVLESGLFALVWGRYARVSGIDTEVLAGDNRSPVDPAALAERLAADTNHEIRAILVAQTDTASSVRNDIAALRAAIDEANHPALFMVDCIASLGCDRYEMDEWGVDITVAACQKGLMVPPGVAMVWASDKAMAAHETANLRVGYFDWTLRLEDSNLYAYTAGTPPVSHFYAMREAFALIEEEGGLDQVWARHQVLADATRAAVGAWSTPGHLDFNITEPSARSNAVTTVLTGATDPAALSALCVEQAGLTLGLGIGESAGFRIGHMGHLNPPMLLGALGTIETALTAMGTPIGGSGVAAASRVIADAVHPG